MLEVLIETQRFSEEIKYQTNTNHYIKTYVPTKITRKVIMKTLNKYWCLEAVIKEAIEVQTPFPRYYTGYGICTEKG